MIKKQVHSTLLINNRVLSGFTLVEMILYVAIVSIFMTGLVYFTWDVIYGRVKSFVHQEVNQNTRFASKRILFEIKNASDINTVSTNSISLEMSDSARNPTVIDVSGGRIRIGYGSSGNCPTSNPCDLTSNRVNSSVSFTDLSSGNSSNIKFVLTVSSTGDRQEYDKSETYETSVELRSK